MSRTNQSAKQDLLIIVMGATGAGKSFFINTFLRQQKMVVGRGLKSCTTEIGLETIEGYPPPEGNNRLHLIDTPGFDDTYENDFAILTKIATWLKHSYKKGAKLGGVIYLHDITAPRFDGPARRNLEIFRNLCGKDALHHVVLGTTKWDLNVPDSEERHNQLVTKYWKPLIEKGAQVHRFYDSYESARNLIETIISTPIEQHMLNRTVLQIQREMSGSTTTILNTSAGKCAATETSHKKFMKAALRPFAGLFRKNRASL